MSSPPPPRDELEDRRRRRMPGKATRSGVSAITDAAEALAAGRPGGDDGDEEGSRATHPSAARASFVPVTEGRDREGKLTLFSDPAGSFLVECSGCRRETPVSVATLVRAAFPFSLHLPVVKRYHSLMRCPACGRRTWVRVRWRA